jgi:glycosyltransferase involved in cell wall biosynthesis
MKPMKASLVIPTYNSRALLEGCLLSINHQVLTAGHSFEVVLVDDGSADGTGEMVAKLDLAYDLRYLFKPRTAQSCRSAARNLGIERASGEVIVMADGDQVLAPGFIDEHLRCHDQHRDLVVIGFRTYLGEGLVDAQALAQGFSLKALPGIADIDERQKVLAVLSENLNNLATCWHFLYGCNASVRREHLIAVGGFDEAIKRWSFEDVELGFRLKARGLTFVYNRYSVVYHQFHPESRERQYADWLANFAYFESKHPNLDVRLQWILDRYFNVSRQELDWVESYLRFEYAVRALHGRLPERAPFHRLNVGDGDLEQTLRQIRARSAAGNLLVVDRSADRHLPLVVQTIQGPNELLYFKQPDQADLARIAQRYHPRAGRRPESSPHEESWTENQEVTAP